MSGGNSSKNKGKAKKHEGWEEAGGEFYQELYPGSTEQDLFDNLQKADAAKLATLLPSKQVRCTTVKRVRSQNERRQSTYARTTQSRDIHLSMLPDLSENLSNEERTWEEIMQIKAMPVPMQQKRELKARLQNATKLRLQGLEEFQWRQRKVWHRFRIRFGEIVGKLELWQSSLKKIEGNFGTGVVSYFLLLRWLLFLNLAISLFVTLFLILPKVLLVEEKVICNVTNSSGCCSQAYFSNNQSESNMFLDAIQGTGWMEKTLLFYGVYTNQIYSYFIPNLTDLKLYYNMPLAYIMIPISWALCSLVCIVKSASGGFKERLVESEGQFYMYCNLICGGWDFCIHNHKSARMKHKVLYNELRACLEEERFKEEKQLRSRESQIILHLKRIFINLVVLAILLGCGVLIYVVFQYSTTKLYKNNLDNSDLDTTNEATAVTRSFIENNASKAERVTFLRHFHEDTYTFGQLENLLLEFLPSICVVGLNLLVPEIFGYLVKFENYMPAFLIKISLWRTMFLRLSSLAVLLSQIYMGINGSSKSDCFLHKDNPAFQCWETYVGQQLYKLILTDFALQVITTFFINLPRALIARHTQNRCLKIICEQSFYIPKHVLDIVYVQTIVWMGSFFCPFLPIIGTIFYFIIFYIKKFTCLFNCTPSPIVYRASKSKSLFMFVLLLCFVISVAPVAYSIAEIVPSVSCGPFRDYSTVWSFMIATFDESPAVVRETVSQLATSVVAVPVFAILLLFLYYYWAVAAANRHMVTVLKNQLVLEGHDKQFLLNRLSAFIRQHQKRCERARNRTSFGDDDSSIRQSSR